MKSVWERLLERYGSWWAGPLVGDFNHSFVWDPKYLHVEKAHRIQAAKNASKNAFYHPIFRGALGLLIALTIGFALLTMWLDVGDGNGTIGAALGFIMGYFALGYAIYRSGIESYRKELEKNIQEAEQVTAEQRTI